MKHCWEKFDLWRLIWILFFKMKDETKCAVFEWCINWTDDYCVPRKRHKLDVSALCFVLNGYNQYDRSWQSTKDWWVMKNIVTDSWVHCNHYDDCFLYVSEKKDSPCHDIISDRRCRNSSWWISLHAFKITIGMLKLAFFEAFEAVTDGKHWMGEQAYRIKRLRAAVDMLIVSLKQSTYRCWSCIYCLNLNRTEQNDADNYYSWCLGVLEIWQLSWWSLEDPRNCRVIRAQGFL